MRIGYPCTPVGVPGITHFAAMQKYVSEEKQAARIGYNLDMLARILAYNQDQGIRLFCISSDDIPFGSSSLNTLDWSGLFHRKLAAIGAMARKNGIRLSMHPGRSTVLNSPDENVVRRAVEDLRCHNAFLDALGMDMQNKLILHVGGVSGDKAADAARLVQNWKRLDEGVRRRLVIENDDKRYHIADVLAISAETGIPVVFDNLHNEGNAVGDATPEAEWIARAGKTWRESDGPQMVYYAWQAKGEKSGGQSCTVYIGPFLKYVQGLPDRNIDIMLVAKDRNLSAVKCVNCTVQGGHVKRLETEWALYKYTVLEHAPAIYRQIRNLLKDKMAYPAQTFYELLEQALDTEIVVGNAVNAAQHVWGYYKKHATEKEAAAFARLLSAYRTGEVGLNRVKAALKRLAVKYNETYLLQSYYFLPEF